jgi:hypothetical protein
MLALQSAGCGARVFFENDVCLACGRAIGFDPLSLTMRTVEAAVAAGAAKCANWLEYSACNWLVPAAAGRYCVSCAQNDVVPDLSMPRRRELWADTERAKRRLVFSLLRLRLPLDAQPGKNALRFRLLADSRAETGAADPPEGEAVMTGHDDGNLTVNVVEADDSIREAIRRRLGERYRTMLGHLRHEIGHYYWYALVDGTPAEAKFRTVFGDERASYEEALERHYASPPAADWQEHFVSAYATMHPWEDFAETWAHYIHVVDTLETAAGDRVSIDGRAVKSPLPAGRRRDLDVMLEDWYRLSVVLNQLNRSMGLGDAYPFTLTDAVVAKLRFVDELCRQAAQRSRWPK